MLIHPHKGRRIHCFHFFNATFNNVFNDIVAISFIGEGNRRKPLTNVRSHNVVSSTPRLSRIELNSQR